MLEGGFKNYEELGLLIVNFFFYLINPGTVVYCYSSGAAWAISRMDAQPVGLSL